MGWGRPIIISTDHYILAGHGAAEAADKLGCEMVPYRMMQHKGESPEALAYMIADNKLTDESDWNYSDLEIIFDDLKLEHFDITLTGFTENTPTFEPTNPEDQPQLDQIDPKGLKCPECGFEW